MSSEQIGHPFIPTQSLWKLIESRITDYERLEVKAILGESVVDQTFELHDEVDSLLRIWEDYRNVTQRQNAAIRLPEPPEMRRRLGQEITFFVTTLRERAVKNGQDPRDALHNHKTNIIEYAANVTNTSLPTPKPAVSCDGRQTPCVESSLDRQIKADLVNEDLTDMSDRLNLFTFDQVVQHFRLILEEEVLQLGDDIVLLQNCLEDEADFRSVSSSALCQEPTLSEMKEERAQLEQEVMMNHVSIPTPPNMGPKSTAISAHHKLSTDPSLHRSIQRSTSQNRTTSLNKNAPDSNLEKKSTSKGHGNSNTRGGDRIKDRITKLPTVEPKSADHSDRISRDKNLIGVKGRRVDDKLLKGGNISEAATITVVSNGAGPPTVRVSSLGHQALVSDATVLVPSPPMVGDPRPSSAARFRHMVRSCREC